MLPDPRIANIVKEIEEAVDWSSIGHEAVEKMAYLEAAIMDLASVNRCQAVSYTHLVFTAEARATHRRIFI